MKIIFTFFLLMTLTFANEMDQMLQQMQKMQTCMAKIDYSALKPLQLESQLAEAKIKELCKSGHQKEAQLYAISYVQEVLKAPILLELKACTKGSPIAELMQVSIDDFNSKDVCDGKAINLGVPSAQRINW